MQHVDEGLLHAYLDGELETVVPGETQAVETHLAGCAVCRARLAEAQTLRTGARRILRVGSAPKASPPPFEALLARADQQRAAPPRRSVDHRRTLHRRGVALGWAASLIIAVGAGWFASEVRFRSAAPEAYGAREMQGVPTVAVSAPAADAAVPERPQSRTEPSIQHGGLTAAEFYTLYDALPRWEQFQRDAAASAESLRQWERSNPHLAQAYPAVHLLRWFHEEVERIRRQDEARG